MMRPTVVLAVVLLVAACSATTAPSTSTSTTRSAPVSSSVTPTTPPSPTTTTTLTTTTLAPSTSPPPTEVTVPALTATAGQVEGPESISVKLGDEALLTVVADVADEVHVHGYDLTFELEAGVVTEVSFVADVSGVFEVELEDAHLLLVELTVEP